MRCRFCGFGRYLPIPPFDVLGNLNLILMGNQPSILGAVSTAAHAT